MEELRVTEVIDVDEGATAEKEGAEDVYESLTIFDRQIREDDRGYYKMSGGRNPSPKTISNFRLKAQAKIIHKNEWYFDCIAIDGAGQKYGNIILSRRNFQGSSSLKQALSFHSDLEYYGDIVKGLRATSWLLKPMMGNWTSMPCATHSGLSWRPVGCIRRSLRN